MKSTELVSGSVPTYLLVADPGDEVFSMIVGFAARTGIVTAEVTGLGALSSAVIGYFDAEAKKYHDRDISGQCELVSLIGSIGRGDDGPALHAHIGLGFPDGTMHGGHLIKATANPLVEIVMRSFPVQVPRIDRPDLGEGMAVLDPDRATPRP